MIYILTGNDTKKKKIFFDKILKGTESFFVEENNIEKEKFFDYANRASLFGDLIFVVFDNFIKEEFIILLNDDLEILDKSKTVFIFREDKLPSLQLKKFKKYSQIENFDALIKKESPYNNVFNIADSFARRDKIGTWINFDQMVKDGVSPEEISGIIFWKIKMMLINGNKFFSVPELKDKSSRLISLYHQAHRGECNFTIGLEQFILNSLNKK
jgi:hypothetical protein